MDKSEGPVHRVRTAVGDEGWLVTDYAEVHRLLTDDRLGRAHSNPEDAARTGESALFGGPLGNFATEDADHTRMRALLQPHFTPKHMRALQPRVEELTTQLLDELTRHGSPADLHAALALPLPILVICELLGGRTTTATGSASGPRPPRTSAIALALSTGSGSCSATARSWSPASGASPRTT